MLFDRASDQTLLVTLGDRIDLDTHRRVRRTLQSLAAQPLRAVRNVHPAYCSLLIKFDPCRTDHGQIEAALQERASRLEEVALPEPALVTVPVCYGGEFGPDLEEVAELHGLQRDDIIAMHSDALYTVYFLGFTPGFAYLGGLDPRLSTARLDTPRKRVEPGSVGIAGDQTGVYPFATPGGWRLIGRTPEAMFRASRDQMSLLSLGDLVRFRPITEAEYRSHA